MSRIIFVNKLDRVGADFLRVVGQIKKVLGAKPLVMCLPIGVEETFSGVVDLLKEKAYVWDDSGLPENYVVSDIPEEMRETVEEYEQLVETAIEQDDDILMAYMGEEPSIEETKCV